MHPIKESRSKPGSQATQNDVLNHAFNRSGEDRRCSTRFVTDTGLSIVTPAVCIEASSEGCYWIYRRLTVAIN